MSFPWPQKGTKSTRRHSPYLSAKTNQRASPQPGKAPQLMQKSYVPCCFYATGTPSFRMERSRVLHVLYVRKVQSCGFAFRAIRVPELTSCRLIRSLVTPPTSFGLPRPVRSVLVSSQWLNLLNAIGIPFCKPRPSGRGY